MLTVRVILILAVSVYLVNCDRPRGNRQRGPEESRNHPRPPEEPRINCRCLNGGSCVYSASSRSYSCLCSSNFTGAYCQYALNPCLVNPCQNNGTCSVLSNATTTMPGNYSCACTTQTTGPDCSIWYDPCANPSVCGTGYSCFNLINGTDTSLGVAICSGTKGWYPSPSPGFFHRKSHRKIKLNDRDDDEDDD